MERRCDKGGVSWKDALYGESVTRQRAGGTAGSIRFMMPGTRAEQDEGRAWNEPKRAYRRPDALGTENEEHA